MSFEDFQVKLYKNWFVQTRTKVGNEPMNVFTSKSIYIVTKLIMEAEGYEGLPESDVLFPEVKIPKK